MIGSLGDFTCFSFYATKTITTGEGGMICTDDDDWAERCRIMSLHGISKDAWKRYTAEGSWYYEIIAPGYKYNMTDIAAAMGLAQLRKAGRDVAAAARDRGPLHRGVPRRCPRCRSRTTRRDGAARLASVHAAPEPGPAAHRPRPVHRGAEAAQHRHQRALHPAAPPSLLPRDLRLSRPRTSRSPTREYQREISLPIYSTMSDQDVVRRDCGRL